MNMDDSVFGRCPDCGERLHGGPYCMVRVQREMEMQKAVDEGRLKVVPVGNGYARLEKVKA